MIQSEWVRNVCLVEDNVTFGRMTIKSFEKELLCSVTWTRSLAETTSLLETSDSRFTVAVMKSVKTDKDFSHLQKTADQKLYEAKEKGRNQVILEDDLLCQSQD